MKKAFRISLIVLSIILICVAYKVIQANIRFNNLVDKTIELEKTIEDNNEQINELTNEINMLKEDKKLLIKEYDVWKHQKQKLEELLQQ